MHTMPDRKAPATGPEQVPQAGQQSSGSAWRDEADRDEDGSQEPEFKPLTREEASALRLKQPLLSPWRVLMVQVAVGVGVALLAALVTGRVELGWSVLYGAVTVVVPGARSSSRSCGK
jgi:ATP synthase protein I